MKKICVLALLTAVVLLLCGCSDKTTDSHVQGLPGVAATATGTPGGKTENEAIPSAAEKTQADVRETQKAAYTIPDKVDLDLTVLSSTMVYSEVYRMMQQPEYYIGKTIRMCGSFAYYRDETSGNEYFACVIADATACCAQGIEFILEGDKSYPTDYPPLGDIITVVGVFDTYTEGPYTYCTLRNAKFE